MPLEKSQDYVNNMSYINLITYIDDNNKFKASLDINSIFSSIDTNLRITPYGTLIYKDGLKVAVPFSKNNLYKGIVYCNPNKMQYGNEVKTDYNCKINKEIESIKNSMTGGLFYVGEFNKFLDPNGIGCTSSILYGKEEENTTSNPDFNNDTSTISANTLSGYILNAKWINGSLINDNVTITIPISNHDLLIYKGTCYPGYSENKTVFQCLEFMTGKGVLSSGSFKNSPAIMYRDGFANDNYEIIAKFR